jgi:hypothetical protein
MKIRTIILAMLIAAAVISTGSLAAFASAGVNDIKGTTVDDSSGELLNSAGNNLMSIAMGIRDSLDNHMRDQYEMVKTWAQSPVLMEAAASAQGYEMEKLYMKWSDLSTREYDEDGKAICDGDFNNDLSPEASLYLKDLADSTSFLNILATDSRGYTIAASSATDDFDCGPDDWTVFEESGTSFFKKNEPTEGGEEWYSLTNLSEDGFYVGEAEWDDDTGSLGIDVVSQIKDRETGEYLGQLKCVFDYGTFLDDITGDVPMGIYEIKLIDRNGNLIASSFAHKLAINEGVFDLKGNDYYDEIASGSMVGYTTESEIDENGEDVYLGYAVSGEANGHILVVSKRASLVDAHITSFIGNLQKTINEKGSDLQRNMWLVGFGVALLIVLVAIFVIKAKISNPLNKLTEISEKLSMGEIEGLELDVQGKDEIGKLGESFRGVLAAFHLLKEKAESKEEARTKETVLR